MLLYQRQDWKLKTICCLLWSYRTEHNWSNILTKWIPLCLSATILSSSFGGNNFKLTKYYKNKKCKEHQYALYQDLSITYFIPFALLFVFSFSVSSPHSHTLICINFFIMSLIPKYFGVYFLKIEICYYKTSVIS